MIKSGRTLNPNCSVVTTIGSSLGKRCLRRSPTCQQQEWSVSLLFPWQPIPQRALRHEMAWCCRSFLCPTTHICAQRGMGLSLPLSITGDTHTVCQGHPLNNCPFLCSIFSSNPPVFTTEHHQSSHLL